jgi:hypothetical protein
MNDSTSKMIEMLQDQIGKRDEVIKSLKRENEVQSIVIKSNKKKYKGIIFVLSILTLISSAITIYNILL